MSAALLLALFSLGLFLFFLLMTAYYSTLVGVRLVADEKNERVFTYVVDGETYKYEIESEQLNDPRTASLILQSYNGAMIYVHPLDPGHVVERNFNPGPRDDIVVGTVGMVIAAGFAAFFAWSALAHRPPRSALSALFLGEDTRTNGPSVSSVLTYGAAASAVVIVLTTVIFQTFFGRYGKYRRRDLEGPETKRKLT